MRFGIIEADSAVDVGCGDGEITFFLSQHVQRSVGIDLDKVTIQGAKKKFNFNNLDFCVARAENLCFPDASISVILFNESLHHVPVDKQIVSLREAYRVLLPGGRLFITEPIYGTGSFGKILKFYEDEKEQKQNAINAIETVIDTEFSLLINKEIRVEYHCHGFDDLSQYHTMPRRATSWNKNTRRDIEKILKQCDLSASGDSILNYSASVLVLEKR